MSKAEALLTKLQERIAAAPAKPRLTVVPAQPGMYDPITRDAVLSRIRDLRRMYRLGWLVRQETFNAPALECLEDAELSKLLQDMERARECLQDDISFEEAGLVRARAQEDQ